MQLEALSSEITAGSARPNTTSCALVQAPRSNVVNGSSAEAPASADFDQVVDHLDSARADWPQSRDAKVLRRSLLDLLCQLEDA
jgi:hypothetical protein